MQTYGTQRETECSLTHDLEAAIGMLSAVIVNMQGMEEILRPVIERLERHTTKLVNHGSIDGTATRVS